MIACKISDIEAPSKGNWPVDKAKATTPTDQISHL